MCDSGRGVGVYGNGGPEEGCELANIAWPIYLGQQQKGSLRFNEPGSSLIPFRSSVSSKFDDDSHSALPINTPDLLPFCSPPATDPQAGLRPRPAPPGTKESVCISGLLDQIRELWPLGIIILSLLALRSSYPHPIFRFFPPLSHYPLPPLPLQAY